MNAKWFCKIDQQEFGPLLIAQLQRLSARGQLKADSYVRREDSDIWISAVDVPELKFGAKKSGPTRAKPSPPQAPPRPAVASIPVAPAAPPVAPTPVTPVGSGPGIQIATHPNSTTTAGPSASGRSSEPVGVSRTMLAGFIALGCVVVVLLVAILFLVLGNDRSDGDQTAADQNNATDEVALANQVANKPSAGNPTATPTVPNKPIKNTSKLADVSHWSQASSTLRIINKATRSAVCNVGIRSIWLSNDPQGEVEENVPATAANRGVDNKQDGGDDVLDLAALGVSKKKRVDITGKILEPDSGSPTSTTAESEQSADDTAQDPSNFRYVFIQVSVSNSSAERPLVYHGWNGDGKVEQAKDAQLFDQDDNECLFVSLNESLRDDRIAERTLAPGQGMVDVLVFELPENGFESLRLVLPKEAIGVPGLMGYEIQKGDIDGGHPLDSSTSPAAPTGVAEGSSNPPTRADLDREIQALREDVTKPEGTTDKGTLTEQPMGEKPPEKKRDAKEEFQELKRLIEAEKERE